MLAITMGRRGFALLIIAIVFCVYGIGIVSGYQPTFSEALHLPIEAFGAGLIASGAITATGALVKNDRWHFSFAAAIMAAWALLLTTNWTQPHGWVASISWLGMCAFTVMIASWPEFPFHFTALFRADNSKLEARLERIEHALGLNPLEEVPGKDGSNGSDVSSRR